MVRVGLATDRQTVTMPCCDGRVRVETEDLPLPLEAAVTVAPHGALDGRAVYRLQVAALKDEQQAQGIADYLQRNAGRRADVVFDAGSDLYRVRYGVFARREDAEAERGRAAGLGLEQAWVVTEGGQLENPALLLTQGGRQVRIPGRWVTIAAPEGVGIRLQDGKRYRTRILIYLNDRGLLNIVNELTLEDYLRGVVPKEMGPEAYRQLEALKAQAVAARTYTVRNLGEFVQEGYDLCATPRCQVYGGMSVEHPLSDRAIAETAGQVVLHDDEPAETFYSAACGGHTENVEVIFPAKRGDYLKGVPCIEAEAVQLAGALPAGAPFPAGLMQQLLPPSQGADHQVLTARLEHLALLADLSLPQDRLRTTVGREVRRFITSTFDLALDPRLLRDDGKLAALVARPPGDWRPREQRLGTYLLTSDALGDSALGAAEAEALLFELALYLGVLKRDEAHFLALEDDTLLLRHGAVRQRFALTGFPATFQRQGKTARAAALAVLPGDPVELYWHRQRLLAMIQDALPKVSGQRRRVWNYFHSAAELHASVQTRYPGFPFRDFEVLSRGVSGRVGRLSLIGQNGQRTLVEGLAVRWTLDLPDTLFTTQRVGNGSRPSGWRFAGRGWGHGVGLCQTGAYTMAVRGATYRNILEHYYADIELGRLRPIREWPRPARKGG